MKNFPSANAVGNFLKRRRFTRNKLKNSPPCEEAIVDTADRLSTGIEILRPVDHRRSDEQVMYGLHDFKATC